VCDIEEGKCVPEDDCAEKKAACLDECATGKACGMDKCQKACEKAYETCTDSGKQTWCHFPPGNLDNPQSIKLSESAMAQHRANHGNVKHGDGTFQDYPGACQKQCSYNGTTLVCATEGAVCTNSQWRGKVPGKK
jgi:hypothetical protein